MQGRARNHPETERERERAGGKEQRSEKVESTMDAKNYVSIRGVPYFSADSDQKSMPIFNYEHYAHVNPGWYIQSARKPESLEYKNVLV